MSDKNLTPLLYQILIYKFDPCLRVPLYQMGESNT